MSLILDALNKNEREQNSDKNKVPDINTLHSQAYSPEEEGGKQKWLFVGIGILIILLLILVAVLLVKDFGGSERSMKSDETQSRNSKQAVSTLTQKEQVAEKVLATGAIERPPKVSAPITPQSTNLQQPDDDIQSLYAPQIDENPKIIYEPKVKEAEPAPQLNSVDREHAAAIWQEMQRLNQTPDWEDEQETIKEESSTPEVDSIPEDIAAEDQLDHYVKVPFLHELPVSLQNAIPTLMYNAHEFDQGFVVLNKKRYAVGDTLPSGVAVDKILYDGLLLKYQNKQFKLSSLSSWVNF